MLLFIVKNNLSLTMLHLMCKWNNKGKALNTKVWNSLEKSRERFEGHIEDARTLSPFIPKCDGRRRRG